ncbi:MAG: hypothetical protein PHF93_09870 [Acidobacteriota bacterium]|jgi:hypothetical protein|nr:hypothetical protein [Acidobacteriota bacterium]HNQ80971.1 hypothetical protein [Candidatus Aminicenantes bacterium]MDD8034113.1 hypothetical protein [Acidobacteriota bacterium]MDW3227235.1 hypothetical protein [Acidobacteriota bacterium]NMD10253.1 hypothetical protein [Acidobacteriota bacterium]
MNFKHALTACGLILAFVLPLAAALQETPPPEKPAPAPEKKIVAPVFSYDPEGRRDPFKDLFGGERLRSKRIVTGLSDMEIGDIVLMGIVKAQNRYEAIVAFGEGFPLSLHEGQKLADGFVLSIEADRVVFRQTSDKGIPLAKPKDIAKEISPEEPAHD